MGKGKEAQFLPNINNTFLVCNIFLKWAKPGLFFVYFVLFKHNITEKTVDFSGIRTRIVGVEGKNADHFTTTTAQAWAIHGLYSLFSSNIHR